MKTHVNRGVAIAAVVAATLWNGGPASAQPNSSLDPSFGASGYVRSNFATGYRDEPYDVVVQPDGKILTAGISTGTAGYHVALARYFPDGLPDSLEFGTDGRVWVHFSLRDQANAIALQPDGKIVAVGMQAVSSAVSAIIPSIYRFNPDGSLDLSFDSDGWTASRFEAISSGELSAVTVTSDDKILAAGVCTGNSNGGHFGFALRRLLPSGGGDPSFGTGGTVLHLMNPANDLSYQPPGVAFLPDGGVLMATHIWDGRWEFVAVRLDAAGAIVPFNGGSLLATNVESNGNRPAFVAQLSDGRIVIAGSTYRANSNLRFTVLCYLSSGDPDLTFGSSGRVDIEFGVSTSDKLMDMLVDGADRIVLAGEAGQGALARLLPDGTMDPNFGVGGKKIVDLSVGTTTSWYTALAFTDTGRLLGAGVDGSVNSGDFVLNRFGLPTVAVEDASGPALGFALRPVYPNPSRSDVTLAFDLPRESRVSLEVYDALGRRVAHPVDGARGAGRHAVTWNPDGAGRERTGAGLYFARFTAVDAAGRVLYQKASRFVRIP